MNMKWLHQVYKMVQIERTLKNRLPLLIVASAEIDTEMTTETEHENQDNEYELEEDLEKETYGTDMNFKHKYLWPHIVVHSALQIGWLIGLYTAFVYAKVATIIWGFVIGFLAIEGVGLGAHRYMTHKAFKAKYPLKVALILGQTIAGQNSMFTWTRDHTLHHKYSDTDADPHNANRGFFFSHMGWLMVKKHPLLRQKQREMDVSELLQDKLVMFQHNYFLFMYIPLAIVFPVSVPMYFWNESLWSSFFVVYNLQYVTNLHITWTINSVAHLWGTKPYDTRIKAAESPLSSLLTLGEGWHNFHHVFPWDYRLSERFSLSTKTLELLEYLGLAYDLKRASPEVIQGHSKRHGNKLDEPAFAEEIANLKQERKDVTA